MRPVPLDEVFAWPPRGSRPVPEQPRQQRPTRLPEGVEAFVESQLALVSKAPDVADLCGPGQRRDEGHAAEGTQHADRLSEAPGLRLIVEPGLEGGESVLPGGGSGAGRSLGPPGRFRPDRYGPANALPREADRIGSVARARRRD